MSSSALQERRIRIALVGLGRRATSTYLPFFASELAQSNFSLIAVADSDPAQLHKSIAFWQPCTVGYQTTEMRSIMQTVFPDVLIVCTPDSKHFQYLLDALDCGVHVLCEKPLVTISADADQVVLRAHSSGVQVRVAHNFRYMNLNQRIWHLVQSGQIGHPKTITLDYHLDAEHGASYYTRWHRLRAASGGLPITKSCHHFDLLNWWIRSSPMEVTGRVHRRMLFPHVEVPGHPEITVPEDADIDDYIEACLVYPGDVRCFYTLNACSTWEGYTVSIAGSDGTIAAEYKKDGTEPHLIAIHRTAKDTGKLEYVPREVGRHSGADVRMLERFGTKTGQPSSVLHSFLSVEQAATVIRIGEAVQHSHGRAISFAAKYYR